MRTEGRRYPLPDDRGDKQMNGPVLVDDSDQFQMDPLDTGYVKVEVNWFENLTLLVHPDAIRKMASLVADEEAE